MSLSSFFMARKRARPHHSRYFDAGPEPCAEFQVEQLEVRVMPYSTSGNLWPHPELVSISFQPDGTNINGYSSNLVSAFNAKFGSAAAWQNQMLRAAQAWAQQTNLNFRVTTDNGGATGSGANQQGDPGIGDIRIGGYNFGTSTLAFAYSPPPANNYSIAGDITFNTGQTWNIGTTYDVFTVAMHEIGHALGLNHSTSAAAVMYSAYNGVDAGLNSDDISGVRAIYSAGAARSADSYDAAASNGTFATATNVTSLIDTVTKTALVTGRDITTTADLDYYKFTAPSGGTGTLVVNVQTSGLSLMAPKAWVYNSAQTQLATATGTGYQGSTITMTVNGIVAGQTYYLKVDGADATSLGTGQYAFTLNIGTGGSPAVPLPNTTTPNGNPLQGGSGQALDEFHPDSHSHGKDHATDEQANANQEPLEDDEDSGTNGDDAASHGQVLAADWSLIVSALKEVLSD